ncbi:MAG: HAD family hydrolase [Myxococcales bacterium]|nr:HAD family hydrolase [Myxococcales bacterium]
MKLASVLWDLDGTLADTAADIAMTVDEVLVESGLPALGEVRVREFVGDGARLLIDRAVAAAGGEPGPGHVARFFAIYRARPRRVAALYPGIEEVLGQITVPQAVVTNKAAGIASALLAELGVLDAFHCVIGGDTLPVRKPDAAGLTEAMRRLRVTTTVMIGDGPNDVRAARAAGVPVIGVDWGIGRPEGADWRVGEVAQLRTLLAELGVCR